MSFIWQSQNIISAFTKSVRQKSYGLSNGDMVQSLKVIQKN